MAVQTLGLIVRIGGTDIGRLESIGDIKFARNTKDYAPINKDEVLVSVGSVQPGDMQLKVIMDQGDTGAQKALRGAVQGATPISFEIELPDKKTDTGNGTKFTWDNAVVYDETITPEQDGFLLSTFSVKLPGFPTVTAAA